MCKYPQVTALRQDPSTRLQVTQEAALHQKTSAQTKERRGSAECVVCPRAPLLFFLYFWPSGILLTFEVTSANVTSNSHKTGPLPREKANLLHPLSNLHVCEGRVGTIHFCPQALPLSHHLSASKMMHRVLSLNTSPFPG